MPCPFPGFGYNVSCRSIQGFVAFLWRSYPSWGFAGVSAQTLQRYGTCTK